MGELATYLSRDLLRRSCFEGERGRSVIADGLVELPHASSVADVWRPRDLEHVLEFVREKRSEVVGVAARREADAGEPRGRRRRHEARRAMSGGEPVVD